MMFRENAYDATGVWTIGYGTTTYSDGSNVEHGQTTSDAQAVGFLAHDLEVATKTLAAGVPYWSTMTSDRCSALVSFGYNLGPHFTVLRSFTAFARRCAMIGGRTCPASSGCIP